jgi:hypothetical protein
VPAAWGDDKLAKEDLVEWAADWDDDDVDSDFDKKLRAELAKHSSATGGGGAGAAAPATGSAPGAREDAALAGRWRSDVLPVTNFQSVSLGLGAWRVARLGRQWRTAMCAALPLAWTYIGTGRRSLLSVVSQLLLGAFGSAAPM